MIKKLATLICAVAFGLAVYSPTADACPGHEDKASIAKKDQDKDKNKKKVADKKKATKDKASKKKVQDKKKDKEGKKVSRK